MPVSAFFVHIFIKKGGLKEDLPSGIHPGNRPFKNCQFTALLQLSEPRSLEPYPCQEWHAERDILPSDLLLQKLRFRITCAGSYVWYIFAQYRMIIPRMQTVDIRKNNTKKTHIEGQKTQKCSFFHVFLKIIPFYAKRLRSYFVSLHPQIRQKK